MKNKHLVLIFILTLAAGLAVRRAPWKFTSFFQAELIAMDTGAIRQIEVLHSGALPLLFLRGDAGWQAESDERSVRIADADAQTLLAALHDMRSIQIVKTEQPDTLGLAPEQAICLSLEDGDGNKESVYIGRSGREGQREVCYLQLPRHLGIYLVDKDLRAFFDKNLNDFRAKNILDFTPDKLRSVQLLIQSTDTLLYARNDSLGLWVDSLSGTRASREQYQKWLQTLTQLQDLPFADQFDESHAAENRFAEIKLSFEPESTPINLEIYRFSALNLPEESAEKAFIRHSLPAFVLRSSQNPLNYFAVEDSFLIHQICRKW